MARMLRTERGLDRLVNFSDATVAIAITLLLLPLVDVAGDIGDEPLGDLLSDNLGTIVAFVVSFAVTARMWVSHHRVFEAARSYSGSLIRVNFVWLASIAFLPFSSNLIAHRYGDPAVNALYVGTVALSSLTLVVMETILDRDPQLLVPDGRSHLHLVDGRLTFAALLVALVLSVLLPHVGMFWLFLLVPAGWISSALEGRSRRARVAPSDAPD